MDVNHGGTLEAVCVVFGSIMQIVCTAPFVHFGSVDAAQAEPCYREAYPISDVDIRKTFLDVQRHFERFPNYECGKDSVRTLGI